VGRKFPNEKFQGSKVLSAACDEKKEKISEPFFFLMVKEMAK
jgi:hypothetical protein